MSLSKICYKVFEEEIFNTNVYNKSDDNAFSKDPDTPITEQVTLLKLWLKKKLNASKEKYQDELAEQESRSQQRLGPDKVMFAADINASFYISSDKLSIRSHGSFTTIKANVCVFKGKWIYEVQLHSKGVMQIGWCSNACNFNENSGVGDSVYSYGFDGSKQQKWNISTHKYGESWQIGDIIGVCIDINNRTIEYYRNGTSLGVAFENIEKGPGIVFFPAVSLGYREGLQANFGNIPLRFPVPGYNTLQCKPFEKIEKADILLHYTINLAAVMSRAKYRPKEKKTKDERFSSKKTIYVLVSSILIERLAEPLLDPYVIDEVLIPYITNLSYARMDIEKSNAMLNGGLESTLGTLLSMLWNFLQPDEIKFVLKKLLNILESRYNQTTQGFDYDEQRKVIFILNSICINPKTRKFYLETKFLKKHCLALCLYLKPPEYAVMTQILPDEIVWTEGIGGSKEEYLSASSTLSKAIESLYTLHVSFLRTLLTNTDGDDTSPSSRKIFTNKLRKYVMDASIEQKSLFLIQSSIHNPIESPVSLSFVCVLLDVVRQLLEEEKFVDSKAIDTKLFFDGSLQYQHFDRVGGVLSHLYKIHRNDVSNEIGTERLNALNNLERNSLITSDMVDATIFINSANLNSISLLGQNPRNIASSMPQIQFYRHQNDDISPGNATTIKSLHELIDIAAIYYYAVGHKYIVKISAVRDEIASLNDALIENNTNIRTVERQINEMNDSETSNMDLTTKDVLIELKSQFEERKIIFTKRSIELARKQAWYRSVALGPFRRKLLLWLLHTILYTLKKSSDKGPLFAFVPEIYINILPILLDTVLDFSFHDLVLQFDISDAKTEIALAADFLGEHAADSRIILASCKDSLLQALGTLICHEAGIQALEASPQKSQKSLIRALLRPYENRAWGQSNWLLLRFWLGEGFAYKDSRQPSIWQGGSNSIIIGLCRSRAKSDTHTGLLHHVAPAHPSTHFQQMIGKHLIDNEPYATAFLNSVLSQLNWAFSEFILLLQEIQNTANRQENTLFDSKQLKICSMCFELTVSLMRCLEMVVSIAPDIVQESPRPNSDLILNRICQLVSQVLLRVTIPPGCFQFIVDMCSPDLNSITHFAIITAAIGILLALMKNELRDDQKTTKITRITRSLLTDPSFQIANLEFALGEFKTPLLAQVDIPRGNFNPQTRAHIDPLTNDLRVPIPSTSNKRLKSDPPVIKFSLYDYPSHVSREDIKTFKRLIEILREKQALLSNITLPSEDSLCPICCAKPIAVTFNPCKHQSCSNCILQHLMNSKLCFYCKTLIRDIEDATGEIIYQRTETE